MKHLRCPVLPISRYLNQNLAGKRKFQFIEQLQTTYVILSKAKDPFSPQENADSSPRLGMTVEERYSSQMGI